jgi:tRNA dimethylallyltransferase
LPENTKNQRPLVVVVGPTASGKTSLAVRLAEALGGEVVSADSVQVYRRFDIGAGKPTAEERRGIPHHMIDVADPLEPMDAARWAALADQAISDIRERGLVPIVCGGTFLWVRALLFGLSPGPRADAATRARHLALATAEGRAALHAKLGEVDPRAAARLAPNDFIRVSRALEVYELTGKPQSEWHASHGFRDQRHAARLVGVRWSSEELSLRIAKRAESMLDAGWVDEVRTLAAAGLRDARAMKSVGYREILEAVDAGSVDTQTLLPAIVRGTRIFARRQRTWLREQPIRWLAPEEAERASAAEAE